MADPLTALPPSQFCRMALKALEGAEGQTRRRKRDQRPDEIGLAIKRDLLSRAAEAELAAEGFEAWLLAQVLAAPVPGPVRAMCTEILDEYRLATLDAALSSWLQAGAPTDDRLPRAPKSDHELFGCDCGAEPRHLAEARHGA